MSTTIPVSRRIARLIASVGDPVIVRQEGQDRGFNAADILPLSQYPNWPMRIRRSTVDTLETIAAERLLADSLPARKFVRAGCGNSVPLEVVSGDSQPQNKGASYYHTTPTGEPCPFPNAYRRSFGRPVYHPSTLRRVVGAKTLLSGSF